MRSRIGSRLRYPSTATVLEIRIERLATDVKDVIDQLLSRKPLLKARQIAKELGVARNAVNVFLHTHPDEYRRDDYSRWRAINGKTLTLEHPKSWVTADHFENVLTEAGSVLAGPEDEICIVFSPGTKPMIDSTARILALSNQLVMLAKRVTMDFTNDEQTRTYLDRAGFFDYIDSRVTVLPSRPQQSAARRHQGRSETLVEFGDVDPVGSNEQLQGRFVGMTFSWS